MQTPTLIYAHALVEAGAEHYGGGSGIRAASQLDQRWSGPTSHSAIAGTTETPREGPTAGQLSAFWPRDHSARDSNVTSQQRLEGLLITQWPVQLLAVAVLASIYVFVRPHEVWFLALSGGMIPMLVASFWCIRQVRRGEVGRAVLGQLIPLWILAVTYTAIAPVALPCFVAVVLLGAVVALPHLRRASLALVLVGSTLVTLTLAMLGELQDWTHLADQLPDWVTDAVLVAALPVPVGFACLALWNYRGNLIDALNEARSTADELRASRQRIVAAGDAERKRIERDLHDGAQQSLMAIMLRLRTGNYSTSEMDTDLQAAIDELRNLAHGIYPPLLANRGLPDALKAAADRSPCPTTFLAPHIGRQDQEIECAIYFCCLEALQNVAKHGGAGAEAVVRVWLEGSSLHFTVVDDGEGYDSTTICPGAGLTNMEDRLGAVGGTLYIRTAPGAGTLIGGTVPL